jgi:hypothetical protein
VTPKLQWLYPSLLICCLEACSPRDQPAGAIRAAEGTSDAAFTSISQLCDSVWNDTTLASQGYLDVDLGPGEGADVTLFGRDSIRERVEEFGVGGISEWRAAYAFVNRNPVCLVATAREYDDPRTKAIWRQDMRLLFIGPSGDSLVLVDSGTVPALPGWDRRKLIENMRLHADTVRQAIARKRATPR